jgi:hypothetical protein
MRNRGGQSKRVLAAGSSRSLFAPLVVVDLLLDLLGHTRESLVQLIDGGILVDAHVLELIQLSAQVLQIGLSQIDYILGNSGLTVAERLRRG